MFQIKLLLPNFFQDPKTLAIKCSSPIRMVYKVHLRVSEIKTDKRLYVFENNTLNNF